MKYGNVTVFNFHQHTMEQLLLEYMSRTPKSKKKQTIKPQYFTQSQQTLQLVLYSVLSKMLHRAKILQYFYRLKFTYSWYFKQTVVPFVLVLGYTNSNG